MGGGLLIGCVFRISALALSESPLCKGPSYLIVAELREAVPLSGKGAQLCSWSPMLQVATVCLADRYFYELHMGLRISQRVLKPRM